MGISAAMPCFQIDGRGYMCVTNIQIDVNGYMCYKYRQRSTRGELFRGANHNHMRDASMQPANIGMKKKFLQITYQK